MVCCLFSTRQMFLVLDMDNLKKDLRNSKILIVDDHPTIRLALQQMLGLQGISSSCISEAESVGEAAGILNRESIDFVLLDINLKGGFGTDLLKQFGESLVRTKFIIYTQSDEMYHLKECLRYGAFSILRKDSSLEILSKDLMRIFSGQQVFPAQLHESRSVMSDLGLTVRELEVAYYISQGKSNKEIAIILHCSDETVKSHRANILKKVGAENSVAASVLLVKYGLL